MEWIAQCFTDAIQASLLFGRPLFSSNSPLNPQCHHDSQESATSSVRFCGLWIHYGSSFCTLTIFDAQPTNVAAYCVFCCAIVYTPTVHIVAEQDMEFLRGLSSCEGRTFGIGAPYCCAHIKPHHHGIDELTCMEIEEEHAIDINEPSKRSQRQCLASKEVEENDYPSTNDEPSPDRDLLNDGTKAQNILIHRFQFSNLIYVLQQCGYCGK